MTTTTTTTFLATKNQMLVVAALLATIPEEARGAPLAHHCHYKRGETLDWTIKEARPEALWPLISDGGSAGTHSTAPASMPGGPSYYEAPRKGVPHAGHRRSVCETRSRGAPAPAFGPMCYEVT